MATAGYKRPKPFAACDNCFHPVGIDSANMLCHLCKRGTFRGLGSMGYACRVCERCDGAGDYESEGKSYRCNLCDRTVWIVSDPRRHPSFK